jgi:hypothetical protein
MEEPEYTGIDVSADEFRYAELSYSDALQQAMQGNLDESVISAMRHEHDRAKTAGNENYLVSVKLNLGVALINSGNMAGFERAYEMYLESQAMFLSAQALQPGNSLLDSNLAAVRENIRDRQKSRLFNPHVVRIGAKSCHFVVIRRMEMEQLSASLFTCDNKEDGGLLWHYESEDAVDPHEWYAGYREHRLASRAAAHDARSIVWRGDICWVSSAEGTRTVYMLFHCIRRRSFLAQMAQSRREGALRLMLGVRGGRIAAHHPKATEKNWSPFVAGDALYMTYSLAPHAVLACDWAAAGARLQCDTVQNATLPALDGAAAWRWATGSGWRSVTCRSMRRGRSGTATSGTGSRAAGLRSG